MTSLKDLVRTARAILLDFDGPVCNLFSAVPAPEIAQDIRSFLLQEGERLPDSMMSGGDPLVLLRWTGAVAPHLLSEVEKIQTDLEIKAAGLAAPTPGAAEIVRSAAALAIPVVIVTNNSAKAVRAYLERRIIDSSIAGISARVPGRPDLMKPNVYLVARGVEMSRQSADTCLLIGDSPTDMQAAKEAGAHCVGYAKRAALIPELGAAGADCVVQRMGDLVNAMVYQRS
ncbi:HAD family hydrolase [Actinomadura nitritigenes]|uniref:HAD family hydrolase n=1 Tax=Actinomadura nitritigenes TaxID=134602 RepID=UPI003D8D1CBD